VLESLRPSLNKTVRDRTLVSFVIGAALLVAVGVAAILMVVAGATSERWVRHTLEVRALADLLLTNLVNAETAARGYVITGQEEFLEPYYASTRVLSGNLASLQAQTADNPSQQALLIEVASEANAWSAKLEKTVALAKGGRQSEAIEEVKAARAKRSMDGLRKQIAAFAAEEERLLDMRGPESALAYGWLLSFLIAGLTASVVLSLFRIRSLRSSIALVQAKNNDLETEAKLRCVTGDSLRQSQKKDIGHTDPATLALKPVQSPREQDG
jgi:CHASE3 domain sensor protein